MKYFQKIPLIKYPFKFNSVSEANMGRDLIEYGTTTDLNVKYDNISQFIKSPLTMYDYIIEDGDTPHSIAFLYYGDHYLYWLILMANGIEDWQHEWPLTSEELESFIFDKYGLTFEESLVETHHYENSDGDIIDEETWFYETEPKYVISVYDHEHEQNEMKRSIKIISKQYLDQITSEFDYQLKTLIDTIEINRA